MIPIMYDFVCSEHGKFEKLCDKNDGDNRSAECQHVHSLDELTWLCLADSPRVECYAVVGRMKLGEVTRGRNEESERPSHVLDTRDLGDGMPMEEWQAKQDKGDNERRHKEVKEMML